MSRIPHGRRAAIALALAVAGVTSACGGNDAPTAAPTPVFPSGTDTPGMTAGGAAPGMSGMPGMPGMRPSSGAPAAPAGPNAVTIDNFAFAPATLTVPVGTTVTWTNRDEEPHTVVATDGSFHSPGMGAGATYSFTFTKPGTVAYVCSIHPFMKATVQVTP
ncbi:cupredoxin domain-containing protein [Nocardia sp. NPDC003482]